MQVGGYDRGPDNWIRLDEGMRTRDGCSERQKYQVRRTI
jgi:hypothetical protein